MTPIASVTASPLTAIRTVDVSSGFARSAKLDSPASTPCGKPAVVVPPQTGAAWLPLAAGRMTTWPVACDGAQLPLGMKLTAKWCVPTDNGVLIREPQHPIISVKDPLLGRDLVSTTTPSTENSTVPVGTPASEAIVTRTGTQEPNLKLGALLIDALVAAGDW